MSATRPRRARRTHHAALLATVTALTALATACSSASTPGSGITSATLPDTTPSTTATTHTGPVPPTPLTYTPGDFQNIGAWIEVTAPTNLTLDQKAALHAWTTYWNMTMQAYNTYGENISTPELMRSFDAVATGQAKQQTVDGVKTRAEHRGFTVGAVRFNISDIQLQANTAKFSGCIDDRSYEVDQQGRTVVPPPGRQPMRDTAIRAGSNWRVSATQTLAGTC